MNQKEISEDLYNQCQLLWGQTNRKSLVKTFVYLLSHNYGFKKISYLKLWQIGSNFHIKSLPINFKNTLLCGCEGIDLDLSDPLWKELYCKETILSGFLNLNIAGVDYFCLPLGGHVNIERLLIAKSNGGKIHENSLQMLCELSQKEYRWYRKLDNSKTLLYQDELTGLFNYRYLDVILPKEIKRSERYKHIFSLLFVDLDHFKRVNDELGHLQGSLVLKQIAKILKTEVREVDTVIRYGGDEFVVILLGTSAIYAQQVSDRIRKKIEKMPFNREHKNLSVTSSIGISSYPDHGDQKNKLLEIADQAMYLSKKKGKNTVTLADEVYLDNPQSALSREFEF